MFGRESSRRISGRIDRPQLGWQSRREFEWLGRHFDGFDHLFVACTGSDIEDITGFQGKGKERLAKIDTMH